MDSGGGEAKWHGVCLALAELARRGLITGEMMPNLLPWVIKVNRACHVQLTLFHTDWFLLDIRLLDSIFVEVHTPLAVTFETLHLTLFGP